MDKEYQKKFVYDVIGNVYRWNCGDPSVKVTDDKIETILQDMYPGMSIEEIYSNMLDVLTCEVEKDDNFEATINILEDKGLL